MQKIIVIGCPGSGKSRFSKQLHEVTKIPLFHLDMMFWNADKTTVEKEAFLSRLNNALSEEEWIIDGNYQSTMNLRINKCDTVFFLDYPIEVCLDGIKERKGKPGSDIPWVETEDDEEFLQFIKNFNLQNRPQILSLLEKHKDKQIFIFRNRKDADEFLKALT